MTDMFEFEGVKLSKIVQKSKSCYGCYFKNQPVHRCNEQQNSLVVPVCYDNYESYIFIEVKDKE